MGESRLGQPTDAAKKDSNGENPFQVSLVDVAPLERTADKQPAKGQQPWRRQWGEVAPAAQDLPQVNPKMDQNPNLNGGNGVPPWRAQPGVAPVVVPGDGKAPAEKPNPGQGDDWKDHVDKNKPVVGPGFANPNGPIGQPNNPGTSPLDADQLAIIEASKRPRSSVTGFLYTGAFTGAATNFTMYKLDQKLLSLPVDAPKSGLMRVWEKVSPAQAGLKQHTDAMTVATEAYSIKHGAAQIAGSQLEAVAAVPNTLLKAAEAQLLTLQPVSNSLAHLNAQKHFLQNIGSVGTAEEVLQKVGPRGTPGALFEATDTAVVQQLENYAAYLRQKQAGTLGLTVPSMTTAIAEVDGKLAVMAGREIELGVVQQRLLFLQKGLSGSPASVEAVLGTAEEVAAGQKLFARGTPQAADLTNYAARSHANAEATKLLDTARGTMAAKEGALTAAKERGAAEYHGSLGGTTIKGFAKGLGISAATLAAGYGADYMLGKQFGYKPTYEGTSRYLIDGVAIPAILLSGMQPRTKIWMSALAFAGARAQDYFAGTGASADMSLLLRPNTIDAIGITATALAPLPGKYKAIGFLGTIAIGRGWNLLARQTGLDGYNNSGEVLDGDLTNLRTIDSTSQTVASFERTAEKAKQLGLSNPALLEMRVVESLGRTNLHPVEQDRSTAVLSYGLGLARLQQGSRLDVTDFTPSAYFLEDKKYDFGCTAAEQMNSAVTSLEHARVWAAGHKNETVNGRTVDDAYVRQLEDLKSKVTADLDTIYGEQNVGEVYSAVQGLCRTKVQTVLSFIVNGNQKLQSLGENLSPTDVRYAAKLARDLCVANMAYAEQCATANNGEDARGFFNAANEHLRNAEAMEKESKNLPKLKQLSDRVRTKIPGAVNNQWNNPVNNPWQIKPGK